MKASTLFSVLALSMAPHAFGANIAIIDSGVDYKHKDLAAKMWHNPGNLQGDDFQDDTYGWNFAENNNEVIDYSYLGSFSSDYSRYFSLQAKILLGTASADDTTWYKSKGKDDKFLAGLEVFGNFVHGTHVSGIASKANDGAHLIAIKLLPTDPSKDDQGQSSLLFHFSRHLPRRHSNNASDGGADDTQIKAGIDQVVAKQVEDLATVGKYVDTVGAQVANGSFGTGLPELKGPMQSMLAQALGRDPTDDEVKTYSTYMVSQLVDQETSFVGAAPNTLFVFAAGNDGTNNDEIPSAPSNIKADNVISVAATLGTVKFATFSNYGQNTVDVAAPGVVINSTIPGDQYMPLSGTSMAAPYVTNVAAQVVDADPKLTPSEVKQIIVGTVDVKDWLADRVSSSGIVNLARAVKAASLAKSESLDSAIADAKQQVADMPENKALTTRQLDEKDLFVMPLPSPIR